MLLDENLPEGGLRALRIVAFATVILGAALLARPQAAVASGTAPPEDWPASTGAKGKPSPSDER